MTEIPLEHVHVAPDNESGTAPAVFVLHGRGADEEDLLPVARHLPDGLHVVSLRAPPTRYRAGTRGTSSTCPPAGSKRASRMRRTSGEASIWSPRASTPLSNRTTSIPTGSACSDSVRGRSRVSLVLEDPDRYAWIVALHGYLADAHADLEPDGIEDKPVFVGAGAGDRVIPESRSAAAADRFDEIGAAVTRGATRAVTESASRS